MIINVHTPPPCTRLHLCDSTTAASRCMPHAVEGAQWSPSTRRAAGQSRERENGRETLEQAGMREEEDESGTETGCLGPHLEGLEFFPAAQLRLRRTKFNRLFHVLRFLSSTYCFCELVNGGRKSSLGLCRPHHAVSMENSHCSEVSHQLTLK